MNNVRLQPSQVKLQGTLVLAIGNPQRGDDGIGAAVIEALQLLPLPQTVTLLDGGTSGLETCLLLQDYERAIIIDAANLGEEPGVWRRISLDEVPLPAQMLDTVATVHSAGLADALHLGRVLNILPGQILIYAVQPGVIGWDPGLSSAVSKALPQICADIMALLHPSLQSEKAMESLSKEVSRWQEF